MKRILAIGAAICAAVSTPAATAVDYSRRLDDAPGVVPQYPVPYTVPTTADVKATLDLIQRYITTNASFRVFDNETGVEITAPDFARLQPAAVIDGRYKPFNRWDYPNGVIVSAFHRVVELTGDQSYADYPVRLYDYLCTWRPYFDALEQSTGDLNAFSKMTRMAALDHCGAMAAGLIRTHLKSPDPRFAEWIDVVDDYVSRRQFRLADGTLARERPQPRSLWADDFYMSIPFLAQMGRLKKDAGHWDDAVRQVTQLSARLFNEGNGLYDHGWSENTDGYDPNGA